jgi:RNA-directed DNA polymerase
MLFKSRRARLFSIYKIIRQKKHFNFTGIDFLIKLKFVHCCELGLRMLNTIYISYLRSVYFFKISQRKNYVLFSPTVADRAKQELFNIVMTPEWEARFDVSSFSFLAGKSCYDVFYLIKKHIVKFYTYSFSFKVSNFFDFLNYQILLAKINFLGFCKQQLKIWLKSFFIKSRNLNISFNSLVGRGSIFIIIRETQRSFIIVQIQIELRNTNISSQDREFR